MQNILARPALMQDLSAFRDEYLKTGQICPGVRPVVRESWERSREYGIDPQHMRPQRPDPKRLKAARKANRFLLECAEPFLQAIHATLSDQPHLVALSDNDGYVLRLIAAPAVEAAGKTANLFEGASWHERDMGCNGVGTCLATAQPVILIGPEHFQEMDVGWTCIGIPIRAADGLLVGVLDFSVPNEHVQSHTWGWMLSIAQNIENRLAASDHNGHAAAEAALSDLKDPFNAVRGVLDLLTRQLGLSPTHARFVEEARHGVDAAAEQLQASVRQLLTAQQRIKAADRQKDEFLDERLRVEEQLRMTQFAMDRVSEAIYWIDPTAHFLYVNDAACQALGYSREELLGMSVRDIDPVFPIERWPEFWQQLRERHSYSFESVHRRKTGQTFPVEITVNYQSYAGREYDFAVVRDITERKRVEEALRKSEDRFRGAIAATRALVYEIDLTTNRVSGFDGLHELLGYDPSEVPISREWWFEQMHPDEKLTQQQANEDFQKSDAYSKEYRLRHKDGHYLHVIDKGKVIRDVSGRPVRTVGSVTDITERKRMEMDLKRAKETAEEASRAKDHFLAVLSHELRTPLTPVMTTVQILQRDRTLSADLRESVDMICRNIELETRLIDDLLDLTRISRGKLQLNLQNVDLHEKVYQVAGICESDIRAKQLGLILHLNAERHHIHGDPARLQQILWNLLKNAIKFTPFGGSISITTENIDGKLTMAVKDTGIGIEPERLVRIFDAFEQGGADVTRLFGGLGLGLSICKGLVDLHGGTISAASEGKNKGAAFTVQLPVAMPAHAAADDGGKGQGQPRALSCRVLLVEDHPDTAKTMRMLLAMYGCDVQVAGSVASALQVARAGDFDLLVSDLGLPDGSGHDLMRQLRLKFPIKGIALSGYGTDDDIRKSIEAGFAAHLTKPINLDKLEEAIRRMLEAK